MPCKIYRHTPPLSRNSRDLTIHFVVQHRLFTPDIVVHAADKVNLNVYRGETLGLVGESGSGKTTIGRGTLRLIEPTSGEVLLDGQNIGKLRGKALRDLRRKMQMVFQDPTDSLTRVSPVAKHWWMPWHMLAVSQANASCGL